MGRRKVFTQGSYKWTRCRKICFTTLGHNSRNPSSRISNNGKYNSILEGNEIVIRKYHLHDRWSSARFTATAKYRKYWGERANDAVFHDQQNMHRVHPKCLQQYAGWCLLSKICSFELHLQNDNLNSLFGQKAPVHQRNEELLTVRKH